MRFLRNRAINRAIKARKRQRAWAEQQMTWLLQHLEARTGEKWITGHIALDLCDYIAVYDEEWPGFKGPSVKFEDFASVPDQYWPVVESKLVYAKRRLRGW